MDQFRVLIIRTKKKKMKVVTCCIGSTVVVALPLLPLFPVEVLAVTPAAVGVRKVVELASSGWFLFCCVFEKEKMSESDS